jgi:hypothetical protein
MIGVHYQQLFLRSNRTRTYRYIIMNVRVPIMILLQTSLTGKHWNGNGTRLDAMTDPDMYDKNYIRLVIFILRRHQLLRQGYFCNRNVKTMRFKTGNTVVYLCVARDYFERYHDYWEKLEREEMKTDGCPRRSVSDLSSNLPSITRDLLTGLDFFGSTSLSLAEVPHRSLSIWNLRWKEKKNYHQNRKTTVVLQVFLRPNW